MLNMTNFVQSLRDLVSDFSTDTAKRTFSDDEIIRHVIDVIRDFSGYKPMYKHTTIQSVAQQDVYTLPSNALSVDSVLAQNLFGISTNNYLYVFAQNYNVGDPSMARYRQMLSDSYRSFGKSLWDNYGVDDSGNLQIIVYPIPTDNSITYDVWYFSGHVVDSNGNYPTISFTDIPILEDLVTARMLMTIATSLDERGTYTEGNVTRGFDTRDIRRQAIGARSRAMNRLYPSDGGRG